MAKLVHRWFKGDNRNVADHMEWINKKKLASNCVSFSWTGEAWLAVFLVENGFTWEDWEKDNG